ncbi:Protein F52C9.5 [Aphelenchoides avenae]|nr:Protein F52C9.5 [Aphelenchus avenae]
MSETRHRPATATVAPPVIQGSAIAIVDEKDIENISVPADSFNAVTATTQVANRAKAATESACGPGLIPRFLKTSDFELYNYDDLKMDQSNGSTIKCSSFEYSDSFCILSAETAVPLGNGQLKQKPGTDYYEKACVDQKLANECGSSVFNRFPQMILVGFAETVVDAPSLQHCFDNCLNSKKLYGFKCISGMYYFEEPQLNCILNTEDRNSQPDLFTSENSDLVDYFETTCGQSPKKSGTRRFASPTQSAGSSFKKDFVEPGASQRLRQTYGWTDWSPCAPETKSLSDEIVNAIRRAKCPVDECCPVFGGTCSRTCEEDMEARFHVCCDLLKSLREPLDRQRQTAPVGFELLTRFDERTYRLWGLQQQATIGDVNVPKENFMDTNEISWMWRWIKGNRKWHAWNECKGMAKSDAMFLFIEEVRKLESELPQLIEQWTNEYGASRRKPT